MMKVPRAFDFRVRARLPIGKGHLLEHIVLAGSNALASCAQVMGEDTDSQYHGGLDTAFDWRHST